MRQYFRWCRSRGSLSIGEVFLLGLENVEGKKLHLLRGILYKSGVLLGGGLV